MGALVVVVAHPCGDRFEGLVVVVELAGPDRFFFHGAENPLDERVAVRVPGDLQAQIVQSVRQDIGPIATFKEVVVVPVLPKTRSGKILRRTMRGIAAGHDEPVPSTIEDPTVLEALAEVLQPR